MAAKIMTCYDKKIGQTLTVKKRYIQFAKRGVALKKSRSRFFPSLD